MNLLDDKKEMSRRDMLISGDKVDAATAVATTGILQSVKTSEAYENSRQPYTSTLSSTRRMWRSQPMKTI